MNSRRSAKGSTKQLLNLTSKLMVAGLFTLTAIGVAQAMAISKAARCAYVAGGSVGGEIEGFIDPETNKAEISLSGFDANIDCGNEPGDEAAPPDPPPGGAPNSQYTGPNVDNGHLSPTLKLKR